MSAITKGSFVEVIYTGTDPATGIVFDTNDRDVAIKFRMHVRVGAIIICVGEGQILAGLENALIGKTVPCSLHLPLEPANAFGKKDAKLIKMIQTSKFTAQKIQPQKGMPVTINEQQGVVISSNGGRTLVDFNHSFANKAVTYDIKVLRIVSSTKEKVESIIAKLQIPSTVHVFTQDDSIKVTISTAQKLPEVFSDMLEKEIKRLVPDVTSVTCNGDMNGTLPTSQASK
jgi:FKBP-type peptidyl-prolyl cis-trans isomerase 2